MTMMPGKKPALESVLTRLQTWLTRQRPRYLKGLRPGAAADLDPTWPAELRTLLHWHDGQNPGFIGRFEQNWLLLSAKEIAAARCDLATDAAETGWNPAWIPFLDDDAGDYVCLDPTAPGVPVREFWLGNAEHPIVAPSLHAWLSAFVRDLEAGKYDEDPERGEMLKGKD